MVDNIYFLIDFDSTFVQVESLETLASIALENVRDKQAILKKLSILTKRGMDGSMSYEQSLIERFRLFQATRDNVQTLVKVLKKNITASIVRNKEFFKKNKENIYIISGGFKEYIDPLFIPYGIPSNHILANTFRFNKKNQIIGFDDTNILSKTGGKVLQIKKLNLKGKKYIIGDGYTDYEVKKAGLADKFFVFCENIKRDKIAQKADHTLPNFDEFLYIMDLPRAYSYPKHRMKILLLENVNPIAIETYKKEGYEVESYPHALTPDELEKKIADVSVLGIRSQTRITKAVLTNAKKLLTIGAYCIGVNQIDLNESARCGIPVFNAPYSNTRSVVELVIGEIIMLSRKVCEKSEKIQHGIWDKSSSGTHEIRGKKLGIIGYGNIGSQLSVLAENLGMQVYFYDMLDKLAMGNAKKCKSLKELLHQSDIVTVHIDGRGVNKNFIGKKEFSQMKRGVLFINTSRGFVVDIEALVSALKDGIVAGAGVDVYPTEPKSNKEKFISPLQGLSNVILTPHIGGNTLEAQENIGRFVTDKILQFINAGNTTLSVNFPDLQLPQLTNMHRLIHIHKNVPGILAQINGTLATNKINVEGQYLKTNEDIGYVITDVNKFYQKEVITELKNMPETIKFRVLY